MNPTGQMGQANSPWGLRKSNYNTMLMIPLWPVSGFKVLLGKCTSGERGIASDSISSEAKL